MVAKKRMRYTIDMVFTSEEEKVSFKGRMDDLKTLLSPPGATKHKKIENTQLILELFKLAESQVKSCLLLPRQCPRQALSCRKQV